MVNREIHAKAKELLEKFPLIAITGPRQSGKTTFARMLCPDYSYVNLELPDERAFAKTDPRGFLETNKGGVIIDEAQQAPELFSYLQVVTDMRQKQGEYILTGSQNFLPGNQVSQSLAGRVALFTLLPFSHAELKQSPYTPLSWQDYLYNGSYPRIYAQQIAAADFYPNYIQTYIERDVRQLLNVSNLSTFQRFIQLLAGRTGQMFHQTNLATETGVDNKTVAAWLSVLEASYIVYRLPPFYNNFSKRLIKTPKLYFYDTGLAAWLLGLRKPEDLQVHFARGALFENLVINEIMKKAFNDGERPQLYFWRDSHHHEVDLLAVKGAVHHVYEIKASHTLNADFFKGLYFYGGLDKAAQLHLVYAGDRPQQRERINVLTFEDL